MLPPYRFYSTKAYNYVRRTFHLALPHPSTIRRWYQTINGKPGFTQEAFHALSMKVQDAAKGNDDVICGLVIDEMAIRKHVEWDGDKYIGFTDIGNGSNNNDDDSAPLASEAYVFVAVSLNSNWKVPLRYFLIGGLAASERENLVETCLLKLNDVGVKTVSLTCDGPSCNQSMVKLLGAKLDVNDLDPSFTHPGNKNEKIHVILDVCHMLKLVRHTLATQKIIIDGSGGKIRWELIEELHKIQDEEELSLGNNLRGAYIQWAKQKMKVDLAAQTISASVADAIEFCDQVLKIPAFHDSAPTVKFIRMFDHLFDVFNSQNPHGKYFKPLRESNREAWALFLEEVMQYISALTDSLGTPMVKTKRKTGFLGFLVAIKSIQCLFNEISNPSVPMNYLLTYKLSQDHLELFFASIRSSGGWNNNPTAKQFMASYKRLLLRHELQAPSTTPTGNCSALDDTINNVNNIGVAEISIIRRYDLQARLEPQQTDHDYEDVPNFNYLSNYKEAAVGYIAGYVVKMVKRVVSCETCIDALVEKDLTEANFNSLVRHKNHGGLIEVSASAYEICRSTEQCVVRMLRSTGGNLPTASNITPSIVSVVLEEAIDKDVFSSINKNMFDSTRDNNHLINLIKCIAKCFLKIRMHHLAKRKTAQVKGENIRKTLTNAILFNGQ